MKVAIQLFGIALFMPVGVCLAEGRNDPFLQCNFEAGRQVTLAENGDALEWREDGFSAQTHCTSGGTVICITEHPKWGPQTLVVANGASAEEQRMKIAAGSAILTTVWFGPEVMGLSQDKGLCQRIGR